VSNPRQAPLAAGPAAPPDVALHSAAPAQAQKNTADRVFRRCACRLLPFLGLMYVANYLDRFNAGFAALTMNRDLGFSATVFGLGGGILFAGYLLFQFPANSILLRLGARRWMFCILTVWGLISAATGFIHNAAEFYILRFVLGLAEAGLFPGVMFYLGLWFPKQYRVRFSAIFVCAIPLSGVVGSPVSAAILATNGWAGLHGWQLLFLLEGLPASLIGVVVLKFLPDGPDKANWLTSDEQAMIDSRLKSEAHGERQALWQALRDVRIIVVSLAAFAAGSALYATGLWLPQIVSAMGFSITSTGAVVALVYGLAMMIIAGWGYSCDRSGERIRHVAFAWLFAAVGFALASIAPDNALALVGLALAAGFIPAAIAPLFTLPASFLRGPAEAGGISAINTIVSLGGFVGPYVIGVLKDRSGNYMSGMALLAGELVIASAMVLILAHGLRRTRAIRTADAASTEI
jgi:MFS transporter, ACS family, tartrate transporter